MGYIASHVKKVFAMMNTHIDKKLTRREKLAVLLDLVCSMVTYGMGINDYFTYRFYGRSRESRRTFIVYSKRMKIIRISNDKKAMRVFDDKAEFNRLFSEFIGRKYISASDADAAAIAEFINKRERVFIKPVCGSHGIGVEELVVAKIADMDALIKRIQKNNLIVEDVIEQSAELSAFNPTSVNSLRVVTMLRKSGDVSVMTANIRFGNAGRVADNFHHAGIAATVDTTTGEITTDGIDKQFCVYEYHPVSDKKLRGYSIPNWEGVLQLVRQAAKKVPNVRYVGWDIAIAKDNEPVIIEGNAKADPDITQIPDMTGKYPLFVPILDEYIGKERKKS